jgi:6-phosphogluconolactonase
VYAVLEGEQGSVGAWRVSDELPWEPLGEQPTGGSSPTHLALSPSGSHLLVANYGSGSVSLHEVRPDGGLAPAAQVIQFEGGGPHHDRQEGPHAHQVVVTDDSMVLVCDLGSDAVRGFQLDEARSRLVHLATTQFPPGSGPRHLALSRDQASAWVVTELSSQVFACRIDGADLVIEQALSSRSPGSGGDNLAAAVFTDETGQSLYVTNRGDDTLARFTIADDGRTLAFAGADACGGHWPRFARLGPEDGQLLIANERSDSITVQASGRDTTTRWPAPSCLAPLD